MVWGLDMHKINSDMSDIRKGLTTKICMNDTCKDNAYTHSRPIVLLSNICWSCKLDNNLQIQGGSSHI